jgi:hypothetical protein
MFDFESVLLHEVGHATGLAHVNAASESGLVGADQDYTKATDGANNVFDINAGIDGVRGSADDVRGDDVPLNWFRTLNNNPFTIGATVDSSAYANTLGSLPGGDLFPANPSFDVGTLLGVFNTEATMQQGTFADEAQRTLVHDDVAGIRYAKSGLDEVAGTADDYTFSLSYAGLTTNADIVIDFDDSKTGFAVTFLSGAGVLNGAGIAHVVITSAPIFFNNLGGGVWFFGEIDTDFGDAPDPTYPTLLASDGARHILTGPFLGASVDADADGQPTANADGDDNDGTDDEDGVSFTSLLVSGETATVDITATAPGLLNAWIDYLDDGDFDDAGEQIFTDQALVGGLNSLMFNVPATAVPDSTFSRFRFDTVGGLSPTGISPNGEVEDYQITISPPPDVIISDAASLEGDPLVFDVSLSNPTVEDIVLQLGTMGLSATDGVDYENTNFEYSVDGGTIWIPAVNGDEVTISAGNTAIKVRIDSVEDNIFESDETFTLKVNSVISGTVGDTSDVGTGTIQNDDPAPSFSIDDVMVTEGTDPTITFTVTKTGLTALTATVDYTVNPNTAVTPDDYTAFDPLSDTLTFLPGEPSKTITLSITDDNVFELTENFTVALSDAVNATISVLANLGLGTILDDDAPNEDAGKCETCGDFNGDGFMDMAVGIPKEDFGANVDAGAVNVIYGSAAGLTSVGNQMWHQNKPGILNSNQPGDEYGSAVTAGDFNGDGFDDLAIGVPFEDVGANADAGRVNVIYGSAAGLTSVGNQVWHQNKPGIINTSEPGDQFGHSLSAGDFNGDGFNDLAIGVPFEDLGAVVDTGAVNVIYGSAAGLTSVGNQIWHQNIAGINNLSETGDRFGFSLACGDFDGDAFGDLAIGVSREDNGANVDNGAVNVIYGTGAGLSSAGNQIWHQNKAGILDSIENGDEYGFSLAAADFDGNLADDLAIGIPLEDIDVLGTIANAGAVNVIYGTVAGLSSVGNQFWHQNAAGIDDSVDPQDMYGFSLSSGDGNGDGFFDLLVGIPGENFAGGSIANAGAANLIYGSAGGLQSAAPGDQFWHQNSPGILNFNEAGDRFGSSVNFCDYDGDGFWDASIGVTHEQIGPNAATGAVNVVYGTGAGLSSAGNQMWHQNKAGILNVNEPGDNYGITQAFSTLVHPLP